MSIVRSVSANGDQTLLNPGKGDTGRFTVSWSALGAATLQLFMKLQDNSGSTIDIPVANGKFTSASVDSQTTTLQSVNVDFRGEQLIGRVTGYSAPFTIWCA